MYSNGCMTSAPPNFGIGRDEIRRRNYIRPEQIPYTNVVGNAIDSGLFAETQAKAQALADWDGFPARRAASRGPGQAARHRPRLLHRGLGRPAQRMGAGALRS